MKRTLSILVVILLASVMSAAHVMAQGLPYPGTPGGSGAPAEAKQIEGKIKSVDPDGGVIMLDDGTRLMVPASARLRRDALKEGATVKVSYEERAGQKIITSIEVQ
jgi:hypothetical protein